MQKRIAIPVYQGRVSPVFDAARRIIIVQTSDNKEVRRLEQVVDVTFPQHRARWLLEQGVNVLICAAISAPLAALVRSYGITLCHSVVGDVEEVLAAYFEGVLQQPQFAMPGCCHGMRRRRQGRPW